MISNILLSLCNKVLGWKAEIHNLTQIFGLNTMVTTGYMAAVLMKLTPNKSL